MGVLDKTNILSKKLNAYEAINVLLYNEVAKKLDINLGTFDFSKINKNSFNFNFYRDVVDDEFISDVETFIYYNFIFTYDQAKDSRELSRACKSLMGIESYLRRLYPEKITYNSSRRLLRDITKVVALDYFLGNNTHLASNFVIHSNDQKNYSLFNPCAYASLFENNPGLALVVNLKVTDTFHTALKRYENSNCKNNTFNYFKNDLLDFTAMYDKFSFKDVLSDVCDKYNIYPSRTDLQNIEEGYQRQRKIIKDELYF